MPSTLSTEIYPIQVNVSNYSKLSVNQNSQATRKTFKQPATKSEIFVPVAWEWPIPLASSLLRVHCIQKFQQSLKSFHLCWKCHGITFVFITSLEKWKKEILGSLTRLSSSTMERVLGPPKICELPAPVKDQWINRPPLFPRHTRAPREDHTPSTSNTSTEVLRDGTFPFVSIDKSELTVNKNLFFDILNEWWEHWDKQAKERLNCLWCLLFSRKISIHQPQTHCEGDEPWNALQTQERIQFKTQVSCRIPIAVLCH